MRFLKRVQSIVNICVRKIFTPRTDRKGKKIVPPINVIVYFILDELFCKLSSLPSPFSLNYNYYDWISMSLKYYYLLPLLLLLAILKLQLLLLLLLLLRFYYYLLLLLRKYYYRRYGYMLRSSYPLIFFFFHFKKRAYANFFLLLVICCYNYYYRSDITNCMATAIAFITFYW